MPRPRIAMRQIREVLRLSLGEGRSRHQVSVATGVPRTDGTLEDAGETAIERFLREGKIERAKGRRFPPVYQVVTDDGRGRIA